MAEVDLIQCPVLMGREIVKPALHDLSTDRLGDLERAVGAV